MKQILTFFEAALSLVLPRRCPPCGTIVQGNGTFCATCWQQLRFLGPPWCTSCALPMQVGGMQDAHDMQCASCLIKTPRHNGIRAVVAYDEVSRQIPLKLKYGGKIGLASMIATHMVRHMPADMGSDMGAIMVTPVPLHWTRLWSRGYNQSALIAQALARQSGLQYIPDLLIRKKRTPLLRGMSGKQRQGIVSQAFLINPKRVRQMKGARIILIDDVLTSGATSDACIAKLKRGGAAWIQLFCWARVLRGEAAEDSNTHSFDTYPVDA